MSLLMDCQMLIILKDLLNLIMHLKEEYQFYYQKYLNILMNLILKFLQKEKVNYYQKDPKIKVN